jgi:hypothetical protein
MPNPFRCYNISSLEFFKKNLKPQLRFFFENPKKDQNCNLQFQDSEFLQKKTETRDSLILEIFENLEPEVLNKIKEQSPTMVKTNVGRVYLCELTCLILVSGYWEWSQSMQGHGNNLVRAWGSFSYTKLVRIIAKMY